MADIVRFNKNTLCFFLTFMRFEDLGRAKLSLIYWFIDLLIYLLMDWLIYWFIDWWINWLIDSLICWFIDLFIDLLTYWFIDWLIYWFINNSLPGVLGRESGAASVHGVRGDCGAAVHGAGRRRTRARQAHPRVGYARQNTGRKSFFVYIFSSKEKVFSVAYQGEYVVCEILKN